MVHSPDLRLGREGAVFGFHKPNSILQFSGTPATRFLGRLGGQASSPISCCCNEMLSLDCRLEARRASQKLQEMAVFQQNSSICTLRLTWRFLGWSSRDIVCCESSAFILRPSSFIGAAVALRAQGDGARSGGMFRDPDSSRSGGRGPPVPYARSRCAMSRALERGLWPGVAGCLSTRTTYGQFCSFFSAMDLALVRFAVEKRISFLAKVHGQSFLRHGQSFARNSRFQRMLGGSARTGHGFHLETVATIPATDRSGASRSHALRGNAVCDALRRLLAPGDVPPARPLGRGRRAARQAFPRRAWEREPENCPVSLL